MAYSIQLRWMHKSTVMVGLVNESVCCVQLETMNAVVSGTAVSYAAFGRR